MDWDGEAEKALRKFLGESKGSVKEGSEGGEGNVVAQMWEKLTW